MAGWSSPSIPLLQLKDTQIGEPISDEDATWMGSLIHLSAVLVSPIYSYVNQNWGRKAAGYLTAIPLITGWILIIFANSVIHLYVARALMGMAMSGVNVFVVMYIGEISEDSIRGALGTIRGVAADSGIMFAYGIGPYLSVRNMGIVCLTTPLLFLVLFFWLPESPMYLLGRGKRQEALDAYKWLRGGDSELAEEEIRKLSVIVETNTENVTLKQLLSVRGTRNALLIAVVFAVVIQFSGMYVITSYASILFEQSGSSVSPDVSAIIIGVISVIGALVSLVGADLAGRRIILISTQVIEGVSLVGLATYLLAKQEGIDVTPVGILPVISISLYCFAIAAGVATLGYVVISEIFRPEARGLAMSVTSTLVWGFAFVTTKFHHSLETLIQLHGCFFFYGGVALFGAVFTYVKLPETKNRSLETILRELNGDPPISETKAT